MEPNSQETEKFLAMAARSLRSRINTCPLNASHSITPAKPIEKKPPQPEQSTAMKRAVLFFNSILLAVGSCGGPLITRLYFVHGGNCVWLSSWLQSGGCPIILIPLIISYFFRRRAASGSGNSTKMIFVKLRLFLSAAAIGLIIGFDNYLYTYGIARLPVSTSALIIACQLAFTAAFAYLLVNQRFTRYSIMAIVLMTTGAAVLGSHTSGDLPAGVSNKQYRAGFLMTLSAAFLYGMILPLVELTYEKSKQQITYTLVLEIQLVLSLFATILSTVGMLINNDFQEIGREAAEFGLGETKYYVVLVMNAVIWQSFFLGVVGVIFSSSSLFSGVLIAVTLPATEILGVIFLKETFHAEKGVSLVLNLCGFVCYFVSEIKNDQTKTLEPQITA
ncbi:purine permease 3-like isoform X1 [Cucurbita pepo subsp. pepo]|uniref:purine permease 3-like isoform X1 n=1 Tax=Cucurbita pepo subsp. pepo TaxID=3664 RepID=UPI000C9D9746|nr:purine permease 3-like isoform X1 [Cucurbita pepo subsp. pepo]XP_023545725.1 purine permease 3-like isoform X1 [Cucurbita pepo subsp. pepo]XP_023545726.1 purine permease 3-like isoform X1 [Cucurbita pepo subsp. pepo]